MKLISVEPDRLRLSPELNRSGSAKTFEERLRSSIEQMGLAEPLKVARQADGSYLVIDGNLRLRAIRSIREKDPGRFSTVPAYELDFERRFEIRYQSDIYQDLLPSQLAALVEHLHKSENVLKADIARYIGVSPATLRNYTGLWRLLERGGLFAQVVELMDLGVFPASNPYAWLRLTDEGIRRVLTERFAMGERVDSWIVDVTNASRIGTPPRYPLKYIEQATASLPAKYYRQGEDVRASKRDLGLRRVLAFHHPGARRRDARDAIRHLEDIARRTNEPVLRLAAESLQAYLR